MPEAKVLGKFEKTRDLTKVKNRVKEIREYFNNNLQEAKEIGNSKFQAICIYAIIDSFAQEYANYPVNGVGKSFVEFVNAFQNKYTYLNEVDPVTLFYDVEEHINKSVPEKCIELMNVYPEIKNERPELFKPRYEVDIDDLHIRDEILAKDVIVSQEKVNQIITYISNKTNNQDSIKKLKDSHKIINLIYKRRNKLVHELSSLGSEYKEESGIEEPFYRDMGRIYVKEGNWVSDNVFEMVIPNKFLISLTENCINNYLDYCIEHTRMPFENNSNFQRRVGLTWNDKPIKL